MPILIVDNGANNRIEISKKVIDNGDGTIILDGDNNLIVVDPSALAFGGFFHLTGGARVIIGEKVNASQLFVYAVHGAELRIGGWGGSMA